MKMALLGIGMLLSTTALAQQQPNYHYGPGMMGDGWWFGMFLGPLMTIIFMAAVVVLVVVAIRWLGGDTHHRPKEPHELTPKSPLDILKERFARGEIDKEEYEERRQLLKD
jgi:putative membrane protein